MVEIVSEDVMDWARDLAALRKFFADEPPRDPPINTQSVVLQFTQSQMIINIDIKPIDNLASCSPTSITATKGVIV